MGRDLRTNEHFAGLGHGANAHRVDDRTDAAKVVVDGGDDRGRQNAGGVSRGDVRGGELADVLVHLMEPVAAFEERDDVVAHGRQAEFPLGFGPDGLGGDDGRGRGLDHFGG
ncbi:MAG: hypothetical protein EBR30_30370, partial [Cytophagia bacterium]|nr:hypothetical protein [Cytophagia bacterium]